MVTITMLPEPKGQSLEEITEENVPAPTSAHVLAIKRDLLRPKR
jgi:hypothetical protein